MSLFFNKEATDYYAKSSTPEYSVIDRLIDMLVFESVWGRLRWEMNLPEPSAMPQYILRFDTAYGQADFTVTLSLSEDPGEYPQDSECFAFVITYGGRQTLLKESWTAPGSKYYDNLRELYYSASASYLIGVQSRLILDKTVSEAVERFCRTII